MQVSQQKHRLAGAAGISGALLFFAGDMLFYGYLGSGAGFHDGMIATATNASLARLFAGGLVGPVAACLCIVGFWHVYLNIRPSAARIGQVMLAAFFVLWSSAAPFTPFGPPKASLSSIAMAMML